MQNLSFFASDLRTTEIRRSVIRRRGAHAPMYPFLSSYFRLLYYFVDRCQVVSNNIPNKKRPYCHHRYHHRCHLQPEANRGVMFIQRTTVRNGSRFIGSALFKIRTSTRQQTGASERRRGRLNKAPMSAGRPWEEKERARVRGDRSFATHHRHGFGVARIRERRVCDSQKWTPATKRINSRKLCTS